MYWVFELICNQQKIFKICLPIIDNWNVIVEWFFLKIKNLVILKNSNYYFNFKATLYYLMFDQFVTSILILPGAKLLWVHCLNLKSVRHQAKLLQLTIFMLVALLINFKLLMDFRRKLLLLVPDLLQLRLLLNCLLYFQKRFNFIVFVLFPYWNY